MYQRCQICSRLRRLIDLITVLLVIFFLIIIIGRPEHRLAVKTFQIHQLFNQGDPASMSRHVALVII